MVLPAPTILPEIHLMELGKQTATSSYNQSLRSEIRPLNSEVDLGTPFHSALSSRGFLLPPFGSP